jgi:hypothetical protein
MKLVTFECNGSTEPGALLDDKVIGLKSAGFPTLLHLIQGGTEALQRVQGGSIIHLWTQLFLWRQYGFWPLYRAPRRLSVWV